MEDAFRWKTTAQDDTDTDTYTDTDTNSDIDTDTNTDTNTDTDTDTNTYTDTDTWEVIVYYLKKIPQSGICPAPCAS